MDILLYDVNIHPMVIFNFFSRQTNPMSLMIMGFFLPLSKGATTSFKPIYKFCSQ